LPFFKANIRADEATSALDEETERILHKSLGKHFKNMTVLIIAHRHSALAQADKVYTMEEGLLYTTEPQSLKEVRYSTAVSIAK